MKNFAVYTQYTAMWPQDIASYQRAGESCEDLLAHGFELVTVKDEEALDREIHAICCEILDSQGVEYDCFVCTDCGNQHENYIEECIECESNNIEEAPSEVDQIDSYTSVVTIELDPTNPEHALFIKGKTK